MGTYKFTFTRITKADVVLFPDNVNGLTRSFRIGKFPNHTHHSNNNFQYVAISGFFRSVPDQTYYSAVQGAKNPSIYATLFELEIIITIFNVLQSLSFSRSLLAITPWLNFSAIVIRIKEDDYGNSHTAILFLLQKGNQRIGDWI